MSVQKLPGQGRERKVAGLRYGFTSLLLSPSSVQPNHSIRIPLSNQYTQEAEEWIRESEIAQGFSENSSGLKKIKAGPQTLTLLYLEDSESSSFTG